MTRQDRLSSLTKKLMYEEPFWGLFFMSLNKKWSEKVPTMGVGINGINYELYINPTFFDSLPDDHVKGVLKHECQHIAFHHLQLRDKYPNKELCNIAMDCEINQFNKREWLPGGQWNSKEEYKEEVEPLYNALKEKFEKEEISLEQYIEETSKIPVRVIFLEDFKELKLDPKAGTDYYYKKMLEDWNEKEQKSNSGCKGLEDLMKGQGQSGDMHGTWGNLEDLTDVQKKLLRDQVDYQLKQVAEEVQKGRGTIPGEIAGYIESLSIEEPPKFNWKAYLRRFVDGTEMSDFMFTRKRINKRFGGNPGKRVIPKKHVLVGVDTSGSVSDEELQEFFHEIAHMYKTGADVTVVHCDTAIHKVEKFHPKNKVEVHGRGGTTFDPVINYYNERKHDFTCLIYVTDGEAPVPEVKIQGKMLWVLSSRSSENGHWVEELKNYAPLIKLTK